ncbi:MAG: NAD(P)/FAD-dependent oxidoreductase [Pseudomonadota bacterium]
METTESIPTLDVVVVGAGAAGIGVAIALKHAGVEKFAVLERHMIGASFAWWPVETRFITPSFPTNSFGMLDLNSVAIGVSPAYSMEVEHPTGPHFAAHLQSVAEHFKLPIVEQVEVTQIVRDDDRFQVHTADHIVHARHVIWAAGEYQYPTANAFPGSELCVHTSMIDSYGDLPGEDFIVIGGYESGIDAAFHLAYKGKFVRVFDSGSPWESQSSDPSIALAPFTLDRMRMDFFKEQVQLLGNAKITGVELEDDTYRVSTANGEVYETQVPPLWAGGFEGSHKLVNGLFELRPDGFPLLNEQDESTIAPGMFLCGAAVRHEQHIFCFIYKYRQRFAVVAKAIANSLNLPAPGLEVYRDWGMYLDDLSCCGEECVC